MDFFALVHGYFYVFFAILGVVIGSFLNVVIYRTPQARTIVKGHSMCMSCGHELAAKDLVPVFSWLLLRGKCRYCKAPVPSRYFKIETLTGIVFLVVTLLHKSCLIVFDIYLNSNLFSIQAVARLVYHLAFLISCCMVISAMMIWYDTINKCFWRLPVITISLALSTEIFVAIVFEHTVGVFALNFGLKVLRLLLVPAVGFIVYLITRRKYTKNELTMDLTFGGIFLFTDYLMFTTPWIIAPAFALALALLRSLSAGKKPERYVGIIGASVVVIYLILSYII